MHLSHTTYLRMAVEEAFRGAKAGDPMEGAVLVLDGMVAGRARRVGMRGEHAFVSCMREVGPITTQEVARTVLYLSRRPCPTCWSSMVRSGIPTLVLPSDVVAQCAAGKGPEVVLISLEDEARGMRWKRMPMGICYEHQDDNH